MGFYSDNFGFYNIGGGGGSSTPPNKNVFVASYDNGVSYNLNSICTYNGGLYKSLVPANSGNLPTDENFWMEIVSPLGTSSYDRVGITKTFNFSDSSPILVGKVSDVLNISEIIIEIITPFDNLTTTISVGDSLDNSRLMGNADNNPNDMGKYTAYPDYKYSVETDVFIYISGINTVGSGVCKIYYN
jgi:hypothetical protein